MVIIVQTSKFSLKNSKSMPKKLSDYFSDERDQDYSYLGIGLGKLFFGLE